MIAVAAVAAALAALFATAVVGSDDGGEDGTRSTGRSGRRDGGETSQEPMELLWSTPELHFASRPSVVAGTVVAHLVDGNGLALVAFDPTSGRELWRRPSTASWITPGVPITVVAGERRAFHLVPGAGPEEALVEAVDVATGEPAWTTTPARYGFTDPLDFCDDDETRLCISAFDASGNPVRWRIDPATGEHVVRVAAGGRDLGPNLFDLFETGDVARIVDNDVVWQRSPSDLFDGRDVSSDNGWQWRATGDGELLVGWLGSPVDFPEHGQPGQLRLVPQYTAGVDAATGETLWVAEGAVCAPRLALVLDAEGETGPWVRCRETGSLSLSAESEIVAGDVDVAVEGFDPRTGRTTWSRSIEGASALFVDAAPVVRLGPAEAAFRRDDGTLVAIDAATGRVTEPDPDRVGWCYQYNLYEWTEPSGERNRRYGEELVAPCDATGAPVPAPSVPDEAVGARTGDVFVWADASGLHAARVPD